MYLNAKIELNKEGTISKMEEVVIASMRLRDALSDLESEIRTISLEEKRDSEESPETKAH